MEEIRCEQMSPSSSPVMYDSGVVFSAGVVIYRLGGPGSFNYSPLRPNNNAGPTRVVKWAKGAGEEKEERFVRRWRFCDVPDSRVPIDDRFSCWAPGPPEQAYIMGRVKLKIKRLENSNSRQTTYAKRKNGILKKANELAILCDIDILLLMFSPTGKPSLCCGKRGVEEVIAKFAQLTPQERAKRQLEGLEALKKTFKKLDHDVNIQEFLGNSTQTVEGMTEQMVQIRTELEETQQRLSYWSDPSKIESLDHLGQMEDSLGKSLDAIRAHKENLEKQQLILQETTAQIQNEMQMPYRVSLEQHYQPLPWIAPNEAPHIPLSEDPNLIPQREIECSGSSSFATYSTYLDLCKRAQSGAFRDDSGFLSELGRSSPQLISGQFSFPSYSANLLASDAKYPADTNLQNSVHLEPQPTFGTHPAFDPNHSSWASAAGPFSDTMHSSWASACGPLADVTHGVWGSTSGPCSATTANGNWASPGSYPVALFDEHYQQPH